MNVRTYVQRTYVQHSGQMSAHVQGLSTSGLFPEHTTERTVREFVNGILLGIFFWWMNHYLNDLVTTYDTTYD